MDNPAEAERLPAVSPARFDFLAVLDLPEDFDFPAGVFLPLLVPFRAEGAAFFREVDLDALPASLFFFEGRLMPGFSAACY